MACGYKTAPKEIWTNKTRDTRSSGLVINNIVTPDVGIIESKKGSARLGGNHFFALGHGFIRNILPLLSHLKLASLLPHYSRVKGEIFPEKKHE